MRMKSEKTNRCFMVIWFAFTKLTKLNFLKIVFKIIKTCFVIN